MDLTRPEGRHIELVGLAVVSGVRDDTLRPRNRSATLDKDPEYHGLPSAPLDDARVNFTTYIRDGGVGYG
jgi:hypothetical protein